MVVVVVVDDDEDEDDDEICILFVVVVLGAVVPRKRKAGNGSTRIFLRLSIADGSVGSGRGRRQRKSCKYRLWFFTQFEICSLIEPRFA